MTQEQLIIGSVNGLVGVALLFVIGVALKIVLTRSVHPSTNFEVFHRNLHRSDRTARFSRQEAFGVYLTWRREQTEREEIKQDERTC